MYQISKAQAFWFQIRRFLKVFSLYDCKTCGPQGRAIFGPRAITWNNLVRGPLGELCIKYQRYGPSAFRQEDFYSFFTLYGSM